MAGKIMLDCNKPVPELTIDDVDVRQVIKSVVVIEMALKEKLNLTGNELDEMKCTALLTIAEQLTKVAPMDSKHGERR